MEVLRPIGLMEINRSDLKKEHRAKYSPTKNPEYIYRADVLDIKNGCGCYRQPGESGLILAEE